MFANNQFFNKYFSYRNRWILFSIYVAAILAGIIWKNPTLFSREPLVSQADLSAVWLPLKFNEAPLTTAPGKEIFYRQSFDRQAIFNMNQQSIQLQSLWKTGRLNVGIHSASKASVVADDNQIYVGTDSSWFYSYSRAGQLLWKFYVGAANFGIHSTAAIDETSVYVGSYRGHFYSLNKKTGQLQWSRILGNTVGASPLIYGNSIVVSIETVSPLDGYLVKINKANGEIEWVTQKLGEQAHSSPTLDLKSGIVVVGANNSTVQGFNIESGKHLWTLQVGGPVKSTILIENGVGYVSSWGNELLSFEVATGKTFWKVSLPNKSQVSPVLLKNKRIVFVSDQAGNSFGIDSVTGQVRWKFSYPFVYQNSSPIVLKTNSSEKILFYCKVKTFCLIDSDGKIEKTWPVSGLFSGSPFIKDHELYVIYDEGGLEAFSLTGK